MATFYLYGITVEDSYSSGNGGVFYVNAFTSGTITIDACIIKTFSNPYSLYGSMFYSSGDDTVYLYIKDSTV